PPPSPPGYDQLFEPLDRHAKPEHKPNLCFHTCLFHTIHHSPGMFGGEGDWFFHEDVNALSFSQFPLRRVSERWQADHDQIKVCLLEHLLWIRKDDPFSSAIFF